MFNSALYFDNGQILAKISGSVRLNMIFKGKNFMNVYNLRFFSLIRTHSYITDGHYHHYHYITGKKKNIIYIGILMYAYRKNGFFCNIAKTRAIHVQNGGHFQIQRAQITLEKLLSVLQQNGC